MFVYSCRVEELTCELVEEKKLARTLQADLEKLQKQNDVFKEVAWNFILAVWSDMVPVIEELRLYVWRKFGLGKMLSYVYCRYM